MNYRGDSHGGNNIFWFSERIKKYLDAAADDFEPITITWKGKNNAVLISEEVYNIMLENQFVLGNPTNLNRLEESRK